MTFRAELEQDDAKIFGAESVLLSDKDRVFTVNDVDGYPLRFTVPHTLPVVVDEQEELAGIRKELSIVDSDHARLVSYRTDGRHKSVIGQPRFGGEDIGKRDVHVIIPIGIDRTAVARVVYQRDIPLVSRVRNEIEEVRRRLVLNFR